MSASFVDMSGFEEEDVTLSPVRENDEVFLIRVPTGYDIEKLNGIGEYSPPGIVQIEAKEGKRGLVSVVELGAFGGKNLDVNLLMNSGNDKVIAGPCIKQSLCVSRSVHLNPSAAKKTKDVDAPGPVVMPSGLKPRFTPFGAGCPVHIELKKHKKHKKKKRERVEVSDTLIKDNYTSISSSDTSNTINHHYAGKRPSTSKSDVNDNIFMRSKEEISETSPSPATSSNHKKKKKRKSETVDFLEYDSHAILNSSNCIEPSGEEGKSFVNANHKKKRKSEPGSHISDISHPSLISSNSLEETAMNSSDNSPHKKKKKKKKSEADDRVFHDTSTNFSSLDITEETPSELENTHINDKERKRGHKRKLSSGYYSLESSIVLDESVSINPSSAERKHKKKKRKKEHDT